MNFMWANSPTPGNERLVLPDPGGRVLACRRHGLLAVGGHNRPRGEVGARTERRHVIARLEDDRHFFVHFGRAVLTNAYTVVTGINSHTALSAGAHRMVMM